VTSIALDATYTVDPQPSGVAVYSKRLIESLIQLRTQHRFLVCYRLSRWKQRSHFLRPAAFPGSRVGIRLFQEPITFWLARQAELFHSLNQRPPAFRFRKEIVTVIDVFPLTSRTYSTPEFQRKFSALLIEAAERATLIITPSRYTADQLLHHTDIEAEKIRTIPFGVDPPTLRLRPEECRLERERMVGVGKEMLLSVGVIQTRKNTLNVLRALEKLPSNYHLVLAGGNGYGSEAVDEFIRERRLEPRLTRLGYVSDERVRQLYQAASVFLFPSLEEGFGLPVLEAMSYGLPVVTSNTSSLPEVGGEAALYVDPLDPGEIADAARRATEDAAARQTLIERGLKRAAEFTWQRTAELNLRVYEEALAM
jgi:glycosyltransferase involved in cell wall biosynthesis